MSYGEEDRPPEPPPEQVRSTPGPPGPVPVRDLMKRMTPEPDPAPGADADPLWEGAERGFETGDVAWIARSAGAGAYGTGRLGTARLVAVHFYRRDDPATPVREALVSAGAFPHLGPAELRELFERATPIVVDR